MGSEGERKKGQGKENMKWDGEGREEGEKERGKVKVGKGD